MMTRFLPSPLAVVAAFAASPVDTTSTLLPAPFGTVRFQPPAIMANFSAAGGPGQMPEVVAAGPGALLRFASSEPKGTGSASESVLSAFEFHADVLIDAHISAVARHPATPGYEALPTLLLAPTGYNQTSGKGPRTQNVMKLHSTINESWFELQTFDNNSGTPVNGRAYACAGARFGSTRLRLDRRGGLAWGGIFVGGQGWWGAETEVNQPTQHPIWVGSVVGPVRVGLAVQSDYTSSYQIDVTGERARRTRVSLAVHTTAPACTA